MEYAKDPVLGGAIKKLLENKRLENPLRKSFKKTSQLAEIEYQFTEMLNCMGFDLSDDSMKDTPKRVAKMYVNELFYGLDYDNFPRMTTTSNKAGYDEMLTVDNIKSMSVCEHHLQTIDGVAKISYIPGKRLLGLSKFVRLVDFFSRRPQVQERLTEQIYYALSKVLETNDIAVMIDATHFCMKSRGVHAHDSSTRTTKLGGRFREPEVRNEFLNK